MVDLGDYAKAESMVEAHKLTWRGLDKPVLDRLGFGDTWFRLKLRTRDFPFDGLASLHALQALPGVGEVTIRRVVKVVMGSLVPILIPDASCGNCRFFKPAACRRFPPPWPRSRATDWCGEWEVKKPR